MKLRQFHPGYVYCAVCCRYMTKTDYERHTAAKKHQTPSRGKKRGTQKPGNKPGMKR